MRLVQAYVKMHKVTEVSAALHHVPGVSGVSVLPVDGWGRGKQAADRADPGEQAVDFERHAKVEVLCEDRIVGDVVRAIHASARTGLAGDGVIYVCLVEGVVRIAGEETGFP